MNPRLKITTFLAGATLAASVFAAPAEAAGENLIYNGGFDTNVDGWDVTTDGKLTKVFGVALASNQADSVSSRTVLFSQCVDVEPDTTYRLSARRWIPDGQDRIGE